MPATTSDSGCGSTTGGCDARLTTVHCWTAPRAGPRTLRWRRWTARVRGTYRALADGFGPPPDPAESAGAPETSDEARRSIAVLRTMSAFLDGQGDTAAATAFAARPSVPLRDGADAAALGSLSVVAIETGYRWPELERYMSQVVRDAVRSRDRAAAGLSALTLARLHFLRARYRGSVRWLSEAEVHFHRQDPFNGMLQVRVLQVGIASFSGDYDGTMTALERLHAWCERHEPLPVQRVPVCRAEGWALRMRNPGHRHRREADRGDRVRRRARAIAAGRVALARGRRPRMSPSSGKRSWSR